jgi:hypothetical protein
MHTPDISLSTVRTHEQAAADTATQADPHARAGNDELTDEEQAALAAHHRHISETSYLPAQADYLHVR